MNQELDCPFDFTSRCTMGRCDCKPKQETLAEAAKECLKNNSLSTEGDFAEGYVTGSLFGSKWQQERMYSEEEVEALLDKRTFDLKHKKDNKSTKQWFEKFKKK